MITLYDPTNLTTSDINTYNITVDVEYVSSGAYLGVYKYTLSSNYLELLQEVSAGYTGTIQTTVDRYTEIYVQMLPFSGSGNAIFNVSSIIIGDDPSTSNGDGGLSLGAVVGILLGVVTALSVPGGF